MIKVTRSSCISGLDYNKDTEVLEVHFNKGGRYQFSGVPEVVYDNLVKAPSVGKFFHSQIEGKYPYHKVY